MHNGERESRQEPQRDSQVIASSGSGLSYVVCNRMISNVFDCKRIGKVQIKFNAGRSGSRSGKPVAAVAVLSGSGSGSF